MYNLYEAIQLLCQQRGIKAGKMCNDLDISCGMMTDLKMGRKQTLTAETLKKIAEYFDVSIDYLLGSETQNSRSESGKGIKIPVLGKVQAGIPIEAIEDILDYEEISEDMASRGEYFALQIRGDSMEPRIREGDVVIVRVQATVNSSDIAIVLVNGNDATCKKLVKHADGISLVSFNQSYEPMFYSNKEVWEKPVVVLGKVVELRGKF